MPRKGGVPENLKHFKKGHAKLGGSKPGCKHTSTILREMLEQDPEAFLLPITDDAARKEKFIKQMREMKKRKIKSVKDLIMFRTVNKAAQGDARALEWMNKNIYEEAGTKVEHSGNIGIIDVKNVDLSKLTPDQLKQLADGTCTSDQLRGLPMLTRESADKTG